MTDQPLPLAGVQVIDLSLLLPGPMATLRLQEQGAQVTKIEPPGAGDGARQLFQTEAERAAGQPSAFWRALNAGKTVRQLDLRSPTGLAEVRRLARTADVVVEGFRPGVLARLGLGWDVLRAENPRLVLCSISGYGQGGAYAQQAGHDLNYLALSGVLGQIQSRRGEPAVPNFQIADLLGGAQAAVVAILAALMAAARTGQGRHIDVNMTREVWRHAVTARTAPAGLLSQGVPCYGVYATADGRWLAVGALEAKFWQRFCEAVGRPEWAAHHWTAGEGPGSPEARAMTAQVAALMASAPLAHWAALLEPADCCVTPVLQLSEVPQHPWFSGGEEPA